MNIVSVLMSKIQKSYIYSFLIVCILILSACSDTPRSRIISEQPVNYEPTYGNYGSSGGTLQSNAITPLGPNGVIVSPATDLAITTGESVDFSATAIDPNSDPNISYLWNFDDAVTNSTAQNPGLITFTKPGNYEIELTAINSQGQVDPTPDIREIIVQNVSPLVDQNPLAIIDSPVGDLTIEVGDIVNFAGSGTSPVANDPISFLWDFGTIQPNSTLPSPGDVTFSEPGEFIVSLTTIDNTGLTSVNPATVVVTVVQPANNDNLPPTGSIISPVGDTTINVGESIYFAGSATDPESNEPITYSWDFSDVIPISSLAVPDRVTFPDPGSFTITMTATDSLGLADPNPPQVTVIVSEAQIIPPSPMLQDVILSPATDLSIDLGQTINFTGEGPNELVPGPLNYLWLFDGVAPVSTAQDPGDIIFEQAGVFTVRLIISDANGNVVSNDIRREITVVEPSALTVKILEPVIDQTISVGESQNFLAEIVDPLGNTEFEYLWTFGGAAIDSTLPSPGIITFDTAGEYFINLRITDPLSDRTATAQTRVITVLDPNVLQVSIVAPIEKQTINLGDILNISGEVIDPTGSTTLEYLWDFNGAAPNSNLLTPGDITFVIPGTFQVTLTVTDPVDLRTVISDPVEIVVLDPSALQANIISPANDMSITVGDTIEFSAEVVDPLAADPLEFQWDFGALAPASTLLSPGPIIFETIGEHVVTFRAVDPVTFRESQTINRTIIVAEPTTPAPEIPIATPQGTIVSPAGDMTIAVGDTLVFEATGVDPNNSALEYFWNFNNGALNLQVQNPGNVLFNTTGEYIITLIVKNADGIVDANPPSVVINVN